MSSGIDLRAMTEVCRRIQAADALAREATNPDLVNEARQDGVSAFWDLVAEANRNGLLSAHYESKCEPGDSFQRRRAEAAAHFLLDVGGPRGALGGSELSLGLGGVAAHLVDQILGTKPMDLALQKTFGSGNRPKNRLQHGAARQFVQLVHYCAGLEGKPVLETLRRLKPDASEEGFNRTINKNLSASRRRVAKNAGAQVKVGATLTAEQMEVAQECAPYLEDDAMLKDLAAWAYRGIGAN
jgi:hypothetical protein